MIKIKSRTLFLFYLINSFSVISFRLVTNIGVQKGVNSMEKVNNFVRGSSKLYYDNNNNSNNLIAKLKKTYSLRSSQSDSESTLCQRLVEDNRQYLKDLPNAFTILRVVLIPVLMICFALNMNTSVFVLFIISAISDWIDGYLARKLKITSSFGAFLDPVADKLIVAASLIIMASKYPSLLFTFPVSIIMCREIAVSALREWMAEKGVRNVVKVGFLGKLKTAFQMISISLLLLGIPGNNIEFDLCNYYNINKEIISFIGIVLLYLSTVLTVVSGWQYFSVAWPILIEKDKIN